MSGFVPLCPPVRPSIPPAAFRHENRCEALSKVAAQSCKPGSPHQPRGKGSGAVGLLLLGTTRGRWDAGGLHAAAHVAAALSCTSQGFWTEFGLLHPNCFQDYRETKTALWEEDEKKQNNFCSEEQILFPSFLPSFPFTDDPPRLGLSNRGGSPSMHPTTCTGF